MAKKIRPKRKRTAEIGWVVVGQITIPKREVVTHYVKAKTEQEAKSKVQEKYMGDQVLMIAGKLTVNGFGVLKDRFGDDDVLDARSVNLA